MSEREIFETFLTARLSTAGSVYGAGIPDGVSYPAIYFQLERWEDISPQGERQFLVADYAVNARALAFAYPFDVQADIDSALQGASAVLGELSIRCERVRATTAASRVGETQIRDAGGLYRLTASVTR